ncbi:MAG: aspartate ammonia-lyase [Candidatus Glassbacteria bacterium]
MKKHDKRVRKKARTEKDLLGKMEIPSSAYYGIQTLRAVNNFPISGIHNHPALIRSYAIVKKAAAGANHRLGLLDRDRFRAISAACDEVIEGRLADEFPVDFFQAGAGTSTNMNLNEVIANRALEIAGRKKGEYSYIHPNDHVNMGQSTNDTFPTSMHIALLTQVSGLMRELRSLEESFAKKARQNAGLLKAARTHLQDGVPVRWGQVFKSYHTALKKSRKALEASRPLLEEVAIGGTAGGTGLNTHEDYTDEVVKLLSRYTRLTLRKSKDLLASMNSHIAVSTFSSGLRNLALELTRIANDLRLLSSGPVTGLGELTLPPVQPGSSIMPGKVNPVIAEMLNMVCFHTVGVDSAVSMAVQAGQLELNVMMPLMANELLHALDALTNALGQFRTKCVDGLTVDAEKGREYAFSSPSIATVLNRIIGYEKAGEIVKRALREHKTVLTVLREQKVIPEEILERVFDPFKITGPGMPEREGGKSRRRKG